MAELKYSIGTNPVFALGTDTSIGDVVAGDHGIAIVGGAYEAGLGGQRVTVSGIVELPKSTGSTFSRLERVFWNTTLELCVEEEDVGNQAGHILVPCGLCTKPAAVDDTLVEVLLNAGGAPSIEVT